MLARFLAVHPTVPTRRHRALWKALTVAIFVANLVGIWVSLALRPDPLVKMALGATEGQVMVSLLIVALTLFGLWKVSSAVVGVFSAVIHSGRHLMTDVPLLVSGTAGAAVLLLLVAPFTSVMVPLISCAVLVAVVGNWLREVSNTIDAETDE